MSFFSYFTAATVVEEPRSLDRWALDFADWTAVHRQQKVAELPGYVHCGKLDDPARGELPAGSLPAFVMFAAVDMPFTIYQQLCQEPKRMVGQAYQKAIGWRRLQQTKPAA